MRDVCLIRFGEVHLKGLNRPYFLRKLVDNIKYAVSPIGGHTWMSDSRIYVSGADIDECVRRTSRVFG
ncbi:MAG: tRNA 4-thiouridine(8) synthase ThiI, partial [Clostridia bacterium]|nr:tRNA 4-thiouridine(8) synthase ThiI [Clostridia bacterium]